MSGNPTSLRALWLVTNYPWDEDPQSGIFYRTQARALTRALVGVTVVAATPWAPWPLARIRPRWRAYQRAPARQRDAGVLVLRPRYLTLPGEPRRAAPERLIARAAWRQRATWRGAHVVHGHFSLPGIAAAHVARQAGLPYVVTLHGDDVNTWPTKRPEWRAPLVAALRGAAAVLAVSGPLADRVHDLAGVNAQAMPIGIDHRAFAAAVDGDKLAVRRELGLPPDRVVALFVGNLERLKGIREFIDGVALVGPPMLGVVVGDGPDRAYRSQDAAVSGIVLRRGRQPNDVVAGYMAAADVLVLPSHSEGLPTVVVEAGSIGLPVIASDVGGIPDLLGGGRGVLLRRIAADEVAAALRAFAAQPDKARADAERLKRWVHDRYDADRNAAALRELYVEVRGSQ